ncbi:MAG: fibrinogen-like YCDxxxxGGGW domain-containing protein [Polyangiales bacterium]
MRSVFLLCALAACSIDHTGLGSSDSSPPDAERADVGDSGPFQGADAQADTPAPGDAGAPDASAADAGAVDAGVDAPEDAGVDAPPEDANVDAPVDVGVDAPVDVGPSCDDGRTNGDETDIDCGGSCGVCALGATCSVGADCESRHCEADDGRCRFATSCLDLLDGDAALTTDAYEIDADGSGGNPSFRAWCDMDYSSGGWTLVVSSDSAGPRDSVEGEPTPGTTRHLSRGNLAPLALGATQVHIRTSGQPDTRSVTSSPDSPPIVNLRAFEMLEVVADGPSDSSSWRGPLLDNIGYRCSPLADTYPAVFHACGNGSGLHWFRGRARWVNSDPNEALELYVR